MNAVVSVLFADGNTVKQQRRECKPPIRICCGVVVSISFLSDRMTYCLWKRVHLVPIWYRNNLQQTVIEKIIHFFCFKVLIGIYQTMTNMQSETAHYAPMLPPVELDQTTCLTSECVTTWRTGWNIHVVFVSGPFTPLCENLMSFIKSEIHNVLHCRQRRTNRGHK